LSEQIFPMEIEGKYRIADESHLRQRIEDVGGQPMAVEEQVDVYLRHPCRDFRVTDEALRVRCVNGRYWMTYKGPRLEGPLKMRPEIEVSLALQTEQEWLRIWQSLGFETVATVEKTRRPFRIQAGHGSVVVTLDQVAGIGAFAEIERVVNIPSELEPAQLDIQQTALRLGLEFVEKRSYLSMVLEQLR